MKVHMWFQFLISAEQVIQKLYQFYWRFISCYSRPKSICQFI